MVENKKIFFIGFLAVLYLFSLAAHGADTRAIKAISTVIVNDADWPPFNLRGEGLDKPGIMKEIAQSCFTRMGVHAEYRALPIERMQSEIQQGLLDINFFSYKKEREDFVLFSAEPAFRTGYRPIVLKGSGVSIKQLSDFDRYRLGHTIGLRYSNDFHEYIKQRKQKRTLDETGTVESNLKKLLAKRIDIFVADYSSLLYLADKSRVRDQIEVVDYEVQEADYFLALSKKSPRVADKKAFTVEFDRCLKELKANGSYCTIFARYGLPCPARKS
jgi:polar amino acid transport system substrate-binding protein